MGQTSPETDRVARSAAESASAKQRTATPSAQAARSERSPMGAYHPQRNDMDTPSNAPCHTCCPKDWRKTPDLTGSFELDEVIRRSKNPNLPARMKLYAGADRGQVYGPLTGYDAYSGYSGDN